MQITLSGLTPLPNDLLHISFFTGSHINKLSIGLNGDANIFNIALFRTNNRTYTQRKIMD